ncbi:hypothetical protein [Segniliparus rugosus]|uniref:Uncharacterized protein n=1 Tax=Segniliparus rugosus (strain ATCC BAA-974 / DSM 45345 / CCUG 50838 / CIP 108380 / JCM 13579 / CDC 945) TaxID=679197 RepID=E5XP22_SEGRC|nr:hypothetical protein [Segniliparus rugosus]EFV13914.1 hypothetical protein HMPREF9336_01243 [Segniliparus rugosus ATCC BAA-974]
MSYDIFAFDTGAVSADEELLPWFREQAEWSEARDYSDPEGAAPELQALYRELIRLFPPLNGPHAPEVSPDQDVSQFADYCIGSQILYVGFSWSQAEQARDAFVRLGLKHGAGVCEVSATPSVIHRPAETGRHTRQLVVNTTHRQREYWLAPGSSAARRLAAEIERLGAGGEEEERTINLVLVPLAPGREYEEDRTTKEFLQTAGTAERLTAEIKRREPDGSHRQYVLGRPSAAEETDRSELIRFGEYQQAVRPSEVLTAAEVVPLFQHYHEHAAIRGDWHLRELPRFAEAGE